MNGEFCGSKKTFACDKVLWPVRIFVDGKVPRIITYDCDSSADFDSNERKYNAKSNKNTLKQLEVTSVRIFVITDP